LFAKIKDLGISKLTKTISNRFLKEYGEMLDFKLDSKNKTIEVEIMLKGEKEPLNLKISSYKIIKENDKNYILFSEIETSREWLNIVAKNFLENKKFEISDEIEKLIGIVV
jgi:hypothetical protein